MDKKLIFGVMCLFALPHCWADEPMRVSVKQGDHKMTPEDSGRPSISDDGQVVAFESLARLTADDTNKTRDIYVFDIPTGRTRRLSAGSPLRKNGGPSVSGNGARVAFHSYAPLKPNSDIPNNADICVITLSSGTATWPISSNNQNKVDGESLFPQLDKEGQRILFTSNSTKLNSKATVGFSQIFMWDQRERKVHLLSRTINNEAANRSCGHPRISVDGLRGAFLSAATNLEEGITSNNLTFHLYWFDRTTGINTRVDVFEKGFDSTLWMAGSFDIDDSGRILVFEARRRDKNPAKILSTVDLFLFDQNEDKVTLLTTGLFMNKSHNPSLSGDGRFVAFVLTQAGGVVVYDRSTDRWRRLVEGNCENPVLSKDGRMVAFERRDKKEKNVYVVKNPMFEEQ